MRQLWLLCISYQHFQWFTKMVHNKNAMVQVISQMPNVIATLFLEYKDI